MRSVNDNFAARFHRACQNSHCQAWVFNLFGYHPKRGQIERLIAVVFLQVAFGDRMR